MDVIELRLRQVSQLFNTLDPFPFRERDIAPEAEEYLVSRAQGIPKGRSIRIVIYLHSADFDEGTTPALAHALANWFAAKAELESTGIRTLFRDGYRALLIGVLILAACLFVAWYLSSYSAGGPFSRLLQESLVIIGWVVIWRPTEMFLYDWLPFVRRRALFRRIAASTVTVEVTPPAA